MVPSAIFKTFFPSIKKGAPSAPFGLNKYAGETVDRLRAKPQNGPNCTSFAQLARDGVRTAHE
jgi:hypothetical protein